MRTVPNSLAYTAYVRCAYAGSPYPFLQIRCVVQNVRCAYAGSPYPLSPNSVRGPRLAVQCPKEPVHWDTAGAEEQRRRSGESDRRASTDSRRLSGESWDGGATGMGSRRNSGELKPPSRPRSFEGNRLSSEGRRSSGDRPPIAPTTPSGALLPVFSVTPYPFPVPFLPVVFPFPLPVSRPLPFPSFLFPVFVVLVRSLRLMLMCYTSTPFECLLPLCRIIFFSAIFPFLPLLPMGVGCHQEETLDKLLRH
jgi:hypothetical protein